MHTYIRVHTHMCTHTYTYAHIHTYKTCTHILTPTHTHTYSHILTPTHIHHSCILTPFFLHTRTILLAYSHHSSCILTPFFPAYSQGTVTFRVLVPNMPEHQEWKLKGQMLPVTLPITDPVSSLSLSLSPSSSVRNSFWMQDGVSLLYNLQEGLLVPGFCSGLIREGGGDLCCVHVCALSV